MYQAMHEILNEGRVGEFKLEKYTIEEKNLAAMFQGIPKGDYIKLCNNYGVVMSNTPMEKRTNREFCRRANGDVFIAGLGIGLIILSIQDNEKVKSITVLEKYPEVIELVGKQLPLNDKVKIIQGDVFKYDFAKGIKFDTIYFDIWDYINSDVYEEMVELKKKYRKYRRSTTVNPNFYIGCWAEYQAKRNLRLI
jgi:spermidine synthase